MKAAGQISPRCKVRQSRGSDVSSADVVESDDNQVVEALARGLALLDVFRRADVGLGNAELAERTGLAKPTVSRLTYTLARYEYLVFDQERRTYRLGVGAVTLGAVALAMTNVRTTALPLMKQLAVGGCFNVGLGTRAGRQMIYTDVCEGDALISLRLVTGSRIPMATTAMGRAYLNVVPSTERDGLLADLRLRYDAEWPTIRTGIKTAGDELAKYGYCASLGDWQRDIHGIAVPVCAPCGQAIHVLNLGGPAFALLEQELREKLAPRLVALAAEVEAKLGLSALSVPEEVREGA